MAKILHQSSWLTFPLTIIVLLVVTSFGCSSTAFLAPTPTVFPTATPTVSPTATLIPSQTPHSATWTLNLLAPQEDTLLTGEQRIWDFEAPIDSLVLLSLEARIDWDYPAGSAKIMELLVNESPITAELLINKPFTYTFADGRSFVYYGGTPSYWELFFSPDYISNDLPNSHRQVLEGQAYFYSI